MKRKNSRCSQGRESDLKISTFGTQAMKQNIKQNVEQLSGCASQMGTVPMKCAETLKRKKKFCGEIPKIIKEIQTKNYPVQLMHII